MPDQLAHLIFARRVVAAADERVRALVCPVSNAFRTGTFGPDPLFNDPAPRCRAEGFELHRHSGRDALERLRAPMKQRMPWIMDYAAGFFCHYALDRICHPDIKAMAARGEIRHVALETAYDRRLRLRGEGTLPVRIALSASALRACAQIYSRISPARFRMDLAAYWQIRRVLVLGGGSFLAHVPGKFQDRLDGLIPYAEPDPALLRGMDMLDGLMQDGVAPAAQQLNLFFDAVAQDLPFDPWTDADFSGAVPAQKREEM